MYIRPTCSLYQRPLHSTRDMQLLSLVAASQRVFCASDKRCYRYILLARTWSGRSYAAGSGSEVRFTFLIWNFFFL